MKIFLLPICLLVAGQSMAQQNQIKLDKDQKIEIVSTIKEEMDMGMGMSKSEYTTTHFFQVIADTENEYQVTSKLEKIKLKSNSNGKEHNYDSDIPEDRNGKMGSFFGFDFETIDTLTLDKIKGKIAIDTAADLAVEEEEEDDAGMLGGMIGEMSSEDIPNLLGSAFFTDLKNRKPGDRWVDSNMVDGLTNKTAYTYDKLENNIAYISISGSQIGTESMNEEGMTMTIVSNKQNTGSFEVNSDTYLVKKRNIVSEFNSSVEMMGDTMEMKGKIYTLIEYK